MLTVAGDPESLLRWTSKSVRHLAEGLRELGHKAHFTTVAQLLRGLGYSLQANVKTREGRQHPDRDAQFRHINAVAKRAVDRAPAGDLGRHQEEGAGRRFQERRAASGGPRASRSWCACTTSRTSSSARRSLTASTTSAPIEGWVNVGIDHDTAQFAVNSIRSWWEHLGQPTATRTPPGCRSPPTAAAPTATARGYGRSSCRSSPIETGLEIAVCHFPPGTSKWNRIEHRLFSFITMNWRGKPLVSLETIINLIGATTTSTGLEVYARLDEAPTPTRSRSQTPTSRPSTSTATSSIPSGTTASNRKLNYLQTLRLPQAAGWSS